MQSRAMGYLEGGHWGTHWALTGVSLGSHSGSHWGLTGVSLGLAEPSELPRPSFGGDFLRTYFLHENRHPKLTQKVVIFGPLDVVKT